MLMGIFEPMSQRIDRLTPPRHCKTKLIHPVALLLGLPILENPESLALSPVCHELGLLQQEEPANLALAFWAGHLVPVNPIHRFQAVLPPLGRTGDADPLAIDHAFACLVMDHGSFPGCAYLGGWLCLQMRGIRRGPKSLLRCPKATAFLLEEFPFRLEPIIQFVAWLKFPLFCLVKSPFSNLGIPVGQFL